MRNPQLSGRDLNNQMKGKKPTPENVIFPFFPFSLQMLQPAYMFLLLCSIPF